ncbi:hypothetical protein KX816_01455 [Sphingosinicellaceae bacterium]|nr:hypothetical protein KX816_01455 [Sphingosinicellaceae bacterium]
MARPFVPDDYDVDLVTEAMEVMVVDGEVVVMSGASMIVLDAASASLSGHRLIAAARQIEQL